MTSENKSGSQNEKWYQSPSLIFVGVIVAVVIFWTLNLAIVIHIFGGPKNASEAGELFGAVNALFSGLAFAGVICTIWLQRKDLEYQRNQLELQRRELELQREEMAGSRAELSRQATIQKQAMLTSVAHLKITSENAKIKQLELALANEGRLHYNGYREKISEHTGEMDKTINNLQTLIDSLEPKNP